MNSSHVGKGQAQRAPANDCLLRRFKYSTLAPTLGTQAGARLLAPFPERPVRRQSRVDCTTSHDYRRIESKL